MIDGRNTDNVIAKEFNQEQKKAWFSLRSKSFLHNIDTFYYSVLLEEDFTGDSKNKNVLQLRQYFEKFKLEDFCDVVPLSFPGCSVQLNYRAFTFSGMYKYCIECPDVFDIFIADSVPSEVTSQIVVQLRSRPLWLDTTIGAFEYSYDVVKSVCAFFGLHILEVKENRVDFAWHTNYLQNPEKFFRIDNFSRMQVSRYKSVQYLYHFKPGDNYENDYIALGKRSDKCFVRIYLKSKEVIEQQAKPWFLQIWKNNGLISEYDFWVYDKLYELGRWNLLDTVRLQFYIEYGSDEYIKAQCRNLIESVTPNYEAISVLANRLTPRVTLITNVEFQTTRKSSKSYCLLEKEDNKKYGEAARIYDYMDNRRLITEYLTRATLRLVDPDTDINKSRCDYCAFWAALRAAKQMEVRRTKHHIKMVREYSRKKDIEKVKKRMLHSVVTYGLYIKGVNDDDVAKDALDALVMLNDNDLQAMKRYKILKTIEFNQDDLAHPAAVSPPEFGLINLESGEIYDG